MSSVLSKNIMSEQLNAQCAWCGAYRQSCHWDKQGCDSSLATTHGICPSCAISQLKIPMETFKKLCQAEQLRT